MKIFELNLFGFIVAPSYYGLMYVLSFMIGYFLLKQKKVFPKEQLENLFIYIFLGVILGGRIGYILFYNLSYYISHPLQVFAVWQGGMSFHGGLIGVILASYLFSKKYDFSFLRLMDLLALIVPIGLFFGRIGNYLNKELLGFPYSGFLAVQTYTGSYFPSPLIEALFEGIILFFVLYFITKKQKFLGQISASFLIFYGLFRSVIELFIRQPDSQIGYYFGLFTQGAILSFLMFVLGIVLYKKFYKINHIGQK